MQPTTATINLPPSLAQAAEIYIQSGWATDLNTLVVEALRRYLEAHQVELQERFLREDIAWGLRGDE